MSCGAEQKVLGIDQGVGDYISYVEKYATNMHITIEEAETHEQVRLVKQYYKEEEEKREQQIRQ